MILIHIHMIYELISYNIYILLIKNLSLANI